MRKLLQIGLATLFFGLAASYLASGGQRTVMSAAPEAGSFRERMDRSLTPRAKQGDYTAPEGRFDAQVLAFDGSSRRWWGFGPSQGQSPAATVILLHGSNRDGRSMLDMWEDTARRNRLVLIAPDAQDSRGWSGKEDGPAFLSAVLEQAKQVHAIDQKRVYLFGHSSGANFALALASANALLPEVRAIAVHAGVAPGNRSGANASPTAIRIYVGDRDHLFPVEAVRASAQALSRAGHDTELVLIPNHTHWFYEIGPQLAQDAWAYFKSH